MQQSSAMLASSPGHSRILSRSHGEKLGEGLGSKLHHELEMVDSVCTSPDFLHGCEIKSGSGLGTRLVPCTDKSKFSSQQVYSVPSEGRNV